MPQRLQALQQWLDGPLALRDYALTPASGDASFRRYFRLSWPDRQSRIAMDAPPAQENCAPFVAIAETLQQIGIRTPTIYAADLPQGFLLLEDLGATLYLDQLTSENADRLYGDALGALMTMQACAPHQQLPPYDRALLLQEMGLFRDWLVERLLQIRLPPSEQQQLAKSFELLIDNARAQPQCFVHRDYHARNLMVTGGHNPGVLDFQDAVSGPVTYDLVSLLRDCYIRWPRQQVEKWAMGYYQLALHSGLLRQEHEADFLRWFDLMGVQRHLKASGIFARLHLRDNKPDYLKDIPRTLGYIQEISAIYPPLHPLAAITEQVAARLDALGGGSWAEERKRVNE